MSDDGNASGPRTGTGTGNESGTASPAPRRTGRRAAVLAAVFVVGALGGGAVVMSADAWSHWGRWGGGGHKGHHGDPARWKGHMEDRALSWLDRVDATDEQREAVRTIVGQAFDDLSDAVGEHRALRREWLTELERPELDAGALEALRTRHVALVDSKSRRALEAIVEAGSVLTAEQRAELVSMLSRHRERRHERRRGSDEG